MGALLDVGERRGVGARPLAGRNTRSCPPSQLIEGNLAIATARVSQGGWAMISLALAEERHLSIGQPFTLPSPYPLALRVAAIGTNIGWAPGAIVMNAKDFVRGVGKPRPVRPGGACRTAGRGARHPPADRAHALGHGPAGA